MRPWVAFRRFSIAVSGLACTLIPAHPAHALDPNQRLTQYLHSSWRIQDGSAPATMFTISQSSDGFLWFSSQTRGVYRFDGVRFLSWHLPSKDRSPVFKVVGDRTGGVWVLSQGGIAHIDNGVLASHFELPGLLWAAGISMEADGSLWVVRGRNIVSDAPLCHVTDSTVRCFGKSDGIPISPADALLADRRSCAVSSRSDRVVLGTSQR
jgi:streptogramin lyase